MKFDPFGYHKAALVGIMGNSKVKGCVAGWWRKGSCVKSLDCESHLPVMRGRNTGNEPLDSSNIRV